MSQHSVESVSHRVWAYLQLLPPLVGLSLFLGAVYVGVVPHPDVPVLVTIPPWVFDNGLHEPVPLAAIGGAGLALALWPLRPR